MAIQAVGVIAQQTATNAMKGAVIGAGAGVGFLLLLAGSREQFCRTAIFSQESFRSDLKGAAQALRCCQQVEISQITPMACAVLGGIVGAGYDFVTSVYNYIGTSRSFLSVPPHSV